MAFVYLLALKYKTNIKIKRVFEIATVIFNVSCKGLLKTFVFVDDKASIDKLNDTTI